MNGICPILNCFFGAQFDEGADANQAWVAILVDRAANLIELGRFPTEEAAEDCAGSERNRQLTARHIEIDHAPRS